MEGDQKDRSLGGIIDRCLCGRSNLFSTRVRTEAGNGGGLKPRITSRRPLRYCQKGTVKFSSAHIEVVSYLVKMTEAVGGRLAQQGTGAASRWRNSAESSCALRHGTPSPAPGARNYTMLDPFAMDWIPVLIRSCDTDWDYVRVGLLAVVEGDCDYCHYFPSVLKIPENSVSRRPVDVAYRVEGISLRMLLNNIPNQENTRGILSAEHSEQYARLGTKLKRELGETVLEFLGDEATEDIVLNPDSTLWVKRMSQGFQHVGSMSPTQATSALSTIAAWRDLERYRVEP